MAIRQVLPVQLLSYLFCACLCKLWLNNSKNVENGSTTVS